MGYRPEIRDLQNPNLRFYGTKLYGYVSDDLELPSRRYLISIGKVEEGDFWDYPFPHEMTLTAEQFRKFMELYEKDFDEYGEFGKLSEYHDYNVIQELLKSESDKHIEWS